MKIDFSKDTDRDTLNAQNNFEERVKDFLAEWVSDSETVEVQTSGSTGVPKKFPIEKSRMLCSAEMTCDFLNLNEGDTALLCLPIEYISGKMMVVRSVLRKLKLTVTEPKLEPLQNMEENFSFCAMTPLQVENSLDKIHLINNLIIGGAAVSESLKKKIAETLDAKNASSKIYETYGMSETLSHIGLKQIYPNAEDYFTLFDGVDISLDERGCLKISAPQVNAEILQTNDIVELLNKKQFRFLGRADNVINSGGAKIFPEQLEALVKKSIPNEAVFLGIPDEVLGQKLVLIIEGSENEEVKSLLSDVKFEKTFHKPKEIVFVAEIPRTPNGKVNRTELLLTTKATKK
ncbi:AMP-dependent synthetase [Elizabethkingia meningoseptica]|uniref:AMP-binding protein n=1 Tax=Elizabethkingia meningoseptica TaxID=238 RepID=UPI000332CB8F|nr:AMP-binding protein [Elizabethkingia meningoseptica]AQX03854.1 AMP-dependent synthetase [Elizabethkingia meningoseptica]AQX45893.1 AMP-dependent synthetase [Elizabethkingia meningoseptica]EOR28693.1 O-succinylbenzoic acid-CoA ligase [Elizabethkingia meningoseptica ATCC 13253 = NBRC 12535]KUY15186.1 AMP-dependent synthetase [Elizabethkingia meningoseptica]MDE5488653.1 AMP-binding protein [Elizabethkingia meningoseptica]